MKIKGISRKISEFLANSWLEPKFKMCLVKVKRRAKSKGSGLLGKAKPSSGGSKASRAVISLARLDAHLQREGGQGEREGDGGEHQGRVVGVEAQRLSQAVQRHRHGREPLGAVGDVPHLDARVHQVVYDRVDGQPPPRVLGHEQGDVAEVRKRANSYWLTYHYHLSLISTYH